MLKKIVNESLFEFKKGLDPVDSLGMGRRAQIKEWLDSYNIKKYRINDDYTIDVVNGNVDLNDRDLTEFPEFIQFNIVDGYFVCNDNKLISLRGCPKMTGNFFSCSENKLESLEGAPKTVYGNFHCRNNQEQFKFTKRDISKVCNVEGHIYV